MSTDARDLIIQTDDGPALEAELTLGDHATPRAGIVLCHPHPQYGGTMRSLVISVLFAELSAAGFACLRFNFRGVEASTGTYADGEGEQLDALAAVATMADAVAGLPIALVGWSFGADVSLTVVDPRVAGWVAIAPPLRFWPTYFAASDVRPKHLVLAANDEFRAPADVEEAVAGWTATTVAIVPGASHFFVGRTDRVVTETLAGIARIVTP
ncbi:MAG: alpha/beta hydrolase [Acidimicrobiia bacterium]